MTDPLSRKAFGQGLQRLIRKENLDSGTAYAMFRELMANTQPDLHQGAFLAALTAKGETVDEMAAAWKAIMDLDTVILEEPLPDIRVENSGTGMDSLKTFNVSSAAAIVAAACGVTMTRHGARALTSFCGTVDILESVGLDVDCPASVVADSIRQAGIGLFNGMSPTIHPGGLGRILSQIHFGSTLNIAASLANPARPTHAVRGVWNPAMMGNVAALMPTLGIRRGLVVHGLDDRRSGGMDELSVTGETWIHEFSAGSPDRTYRIRPEEAGLACYPFESIATSGNLQMERTRFLRVLQGHGEEACTAFTCLNAAAILMVADAVSDLAEGVTKSRQAIDDGRALQKMKAWIGVQNTDPARGLEKLEALLSDDSVKIAPG
jgi:anthranilate phosphoribosyltransferase